MSTSFEPFVGREHELSDLIIALDRAVFLLKTIKSSVDYAFQPTDAIGKSTDIQATQLFELEIDTSARLGAPQLSLRARQQRGTTLSDVDHESSDPAGLTDREQEVIRLIADGLSNAHIAEELFISTNTVARHIAGIFAKTESENRVQAANYARKHSLLG